MTEQELLELIATQMSNLTIQVNGLTKDMNEVKATMATKEELGEIKNIVIRIENDHGQKLGVLLNV